MKIELVLASDLPPPQPPDVVVDHDGITIGPDGYLIEWHRIKTPVQTCRWLAHLLEKDRFTQAQLRAVIMAASARGGWSPFGL